MSGELAGRLRSRVTVTRRASDRDALGGADGGWITLGEAWAALMPDGTGDAVAGDARRAAPRWRVILRAGADVTVGDRLVWRGRQLRVWRRVDDPAEPDRIELGAEEER